MTFLRIWTRAEFRLRWRSLAVLALLVALSVSVVLTAVAGARRGATAVGRLNAQTLPAQAFVLPLDPAFAWDRVRALPQVTAITLFANGVGFTVDGIPWSDFIGGGASVDDQALSTVERPVVLSGRLPDPARPDEAVITAGFVSKYGRTIGDTLTARLLSPEQVKLAAQNGPPIEHAEGPAQPLHIVGIVRSNWYADEGDYSGHLIPSPGLAAAYPGVIAAGELNALVRLRGGYRDLAAFRAEVTKIATQPGLTVRDMREFTQPRQQADSFEARALFAFGAAAGIAALVLIWQTASRQAGLTARTLAPLRPTGLAPRQVVAAAALPPVLVSAAGTAAGALVSVLASRWFPIGSARAFEPHPGVQADLLVLAPGVVLTMLVITAAATLSAGWVARPAGQLATTGSRRSPVAAAAVRAGLPVPIQVGARYALEPGAGRTAIPARSALLAAVAGITGVMAALVIGAGVRDGSRDPARYGVTWDFGQVVAFEGQTAPAADASLTVVAKDPAALMVNDTRSSTAQAQGGQLLVPLFTVDPVGGTQPVELVTTGGRAPDGPDEIMLGTESAQKLDARVGSRITLTGPPSLAGSPSRTVRLTVSGIGFTPSWIDSNYTQGGWVAPAAYHRLITADDYRFGLIRIRPGPDAGAVLARMQAAVSALPGSDQIQIVAAEDQFLPTSRMQTVARVNQFPAALGAFLAVLAVGAAAHALGTAVIRRRGELGVLRAIGATRAQVRLILATQATLMAAAGLALGVPLGVALGRTVWRFAADSVPLHYVPPPPLAGLVLLIPGALLLANLVAVLPGVRAIRARPADVLRAE